MSAEEFLQQLEAQRTPKTNTDAEKLAEKIVVAATPRAPTNVPVGGGRRAHQIIKLGIDVHLDRYVVVRKMDGSFPV